VKPAQMSVAELERGLVDLGRRLYSNETKQARSRAYWRQLRGSGESRRKKGAAIHVD
jgi:hypothetical protein